MSNRRRLRPQPAPRRPSLSLEEAVAAMTAPPSEDGCCAICQALGIEIGEDGEIAYVAGETAS